MTVEVKMIGVVGGGQMGSGIALLAASHGIDVWLHDTDPNALTRSHKYASSYIQTLVSKGHFSQDAGTDALVHLRCTSNLEDLHSADIIIEAIVESEDVKRELFSVLDKIAKVSTILASNTSSVSITRLASATNRPQQVLYESSDTIYITEPYMRFSPHMAPRGSQINLRVCSIFI
jgi:3-hydroxybutyryl-CoA dehydrogenase